MVCAARGGDMVGGEAVMVAIATAEKRTIRRIRSSVAVKARLWPRGQREGSKVGG